MRKTLILIFLLGIYLSLTSCHPAANRQAAYDFTPLDSIITGWIDKGYYPGAAICIEKEDTIIF